MKSLILSSILLFIWDSSNAQVNDTTTYEYCEVISVTKNISAIRDICNVNLFIDFGKGNLFTPENPMKDETGNDLLFSSTVDCLNYLATKNWKVGQTSMFFQYGAAMARSYTKYTLSRPKYLK